MKTVTGDALLFFNDRPQAVAAYAAFDEALERRFGPQEPRVQKTQITYTNPKVFACVSLPRRKGEEGILVSLGLGRREGSSRVAVASEPYPGRWTNHIPVHSPEEVDGELLAWVEEAYEFALAKRR